MRCTPFARPRLFTCASEVSRMCFLRSIQRAAKPQTPVAAMQLIVPDTVSPHRAEGMTWNGRQLLSLALAAGFILAALCAVPADAQEPEWIWSSDDQKNNVPPGACHFRRSFTMRVPEQGEISIWCDDKYELYVNGRQVGTGNYWEKADKYDIGRSLTRGRNVVAIKVENTTGSTAGLAVRLTVKDRGQTLVSHSTNESWKASRRVAPFWYMPAYRDFRWRAAQSLGTVGQTAPWIKRAAEKPVTEEDSRFRITDQLQVKEILGNSKTGSLVAMTFNEFGQIIAARENGGLLLAVDTDGDKIPDTTQDLCDKVKNCQGILAISGDIMVVGDGPEGLALYRLSDGDWDGKLENIQTVMKFTGSSGEHGPHGIALGPDGLIYIAVGNHSSPVMKYSAGSPHRDYYEGMLADPKYEDPSGHARNIKVPGGTIIRTDVQGRFVELVAGGLRNPYDLVFNNHGELFVHDSDMESDEGTPWYRPTRLNHIIAGAEFGWRSGWSKWPEYFLDSLPTISDTGRGSPTGMVVYDHYVLPARYRNAIFTCDWA